VRALLEVERESRGLHVWLGPFGLHLFWWDVWKSRPDFCRNWREPFTLE
jgi:hypothetical protein